MMQEHELENMPPDEPSRAGYEEAAVPLDVEETAGNEEQHPDIVDTEGLPYFFTLTREEQLRALEALIFACEEPLTTRAMHKLLVLEDPTHQAPGQQPLPLDVNAPPEAERLAFDVPKGFFDDLVDEINDDLERTGRPFRVLKIAGGYQFATTPQHGHLVQRLLKAKSRKRLTQAALETLAIVAYRQPITKVEVDAIRGVNSGEVVNSLVEKGFMAMVGRSETPGKPLLYGTTDEFLRVFGLNALSDLPKLREIDDLLKTTTTMIDTEDTIKVTTDHRFLRKQLSLLLEADLGGFSLPSGKGAASSAASSEANSGAYWEEGAQEDGVRDEGAIEEPVDDDATIGEEPPVAEEQDDREYIHHPDGEGAAADETAAPGDDEVQREDVQSDDTERPS